MESTITKEEAKNIASHRRDAKAHLEVMLAAGEYADQII